MYKKTLKNIAGVLILAIVVLCIMLSGKDVSDENYVRIFHEKIDIECYLIHKDKYDDKIDILSNYEHKIVSKIIKRL